MSGEFHVARLVKKEKRTRRPEPEPVTVTRVHPDVMRRVQSLPGYDPRRLLIVSETEVVLVNRKDP